MQDKVTIKRQLSGDWHWIVRGDDTHIINRSDNGFHTQEACAADARQHGFGVDTREGAAY